MADYKDVWVYIEHKDGATTAMSYELLGAAKTLADDLGSSVCAFVIADNADEMAKEAGAYGASKVYAIEGAPFKTFRPDAFAKAAASLVNKYNPDIVLFRSTTQGADLSAALAAQRRCRLGRRRHRSCHRRRQEGIEAHEGGLWWQLHRHRRKRKRKTADRDSAAEGLRDAGEGCRQER